MLSPEEYAKTINSVDNDKLLDALKERQGTQGWVI